MSEQTIVVVTGTNRGIGQALARAYLARANHVVVATVRDRNGDGAAELKIAPTGDGSRLLLIQYDSLSLTDGARLVSEMEAAGLSHIDILIPNAGVSPAIEPLETVDPRIVKETFNVNAVGPLVLYQASYNLLKRSTKPVFAPITSGAGTLGGMEGGRSHVAAAYAISKASLNWIALAAHCTQDWLISVPLNPGLVSTPMGTMAAKFLGLEKARWTPEESAERIMKQIDKATRETHSGKFINAIDGQEFPW